MIYILQIHIFVQLLKEVSYEIVAGTPQSGVVEVSRIPKIYLL